MLLTSLTLTSPQATELTLEPRLTHSETGPHGIALLSAEIKVPGRHLTLEDRRAARGAIGLTGRTRERELAVKVAIVGRTPAEANAYRRQLASIVRDHGDDTIQAVFTPEDTEVVLECHAAEQPIDLETLSGTAYEATVNLVAADPVMYELEPTVGELTAPNTPVVVDNVGDVEVWPVFTITGPASGTTTTLRVTNNTTGRFVEVTGVAVSGSDDVVFDFTPGEERIEMGGISLMAKRAAGSRLSFPLVPGENEVRFTQVGGSSTQTGTVEFRSGWVA